MIILELNLTNFKASSIFEPAGATTKIGSSLKLNLHWQILLALIV
jgi:hypothetical protein